ncbi:uncharacterized protein BJ212DRAFT_1498984 [Suillus subaureus]|uniref:Uncharacterized protein n=1 Tax=Suillus subaureus TaxID=48587 RepID=A0A9P7ECV9_9AGAM|nr:uncharacterized protein BJ212DRAFT_1498984 [Suillus subaureus]KAG1818067.1 hypothetical protein BJ212DRAFT_1498984 [Suillus subaureus]
MPLVVDPSLEVVPDFTSNLYAGICVDLTGATNQTEEQVIEHLTQTWNADHDARVADWNQNQEPEAQALAAAERVHAAQQDAEHIQCETEAEKEQVEAEKKKLKMNGFDKTSTIGDFLAPCPAQYTIQKLTNFEYVELWYFSLDRCKDTLKMLHSTADNNLSLTRMDNQLMLCPMSAFKASKSVLADHELMFLTFL